MRSIVEMEQLKCDEEMRELVKIREIESQIKQTLTTKRASGRHGNACNNVIMQYKYAPLAQVRKSGLDRKSKRLITFLKYRALGILPLSRGRFKTTYSAPSPPSFEVIPKGVACNVKVAGMSSQPTIKMLIEKYVNHDQDYFVQKQIVEEMKQDNSTVKFCLEKQFDDRLKHMMEKYKALGYNSVTVKSEMGSPLAFKDYESALKYCEERFIKEPELRFSSSLPGGNPGKKKGYKRKKNKRHVKGKKSGSMMVKGSQLGVRNPRNMLNNTAVVQDYWRYEEVFTTDGSGNLSVYLSLRNPLTAMNGAGVYARAQDFAKLYDEYKVLTVGLTVDFLYLNPTVGDTSIAVDFDSIGTGSYSFADLRDNQYLKIFSGTNQISYLTKVPKLSEGTYRGQPAIIHQGGFCDFNAPPEEGAIVLAFERFTPGVRLVRITSSVKVLMRRRRTLPTAEQREKKSR